MKAGTTILLRVLLRAVAAAFYRHYAGWLIAAGLLLGGVLSNTEHVALIREAVRETRVLVGVYMLPWGLYTVVSARFAFRLWAQPTYAPRCAAATRSTPGSQTHTAPPSSRSQAP